MEKKKEIVAEEKLSAHQICNIIKANKNTRLYIEHKYKNKELSEKEWKENLKKDGLTF
jgi:hypothetical protein